MNGSIEGRKENMEEWKKEGLMGVRMDEKEKQMERKKKERQMKKEKEQMVKQIKND